MPRKHSRKVGSLEDDTDARIPLGMSRQLPAPEDEKNRTKSTRVSKQKSVPETTSNSTPIPIPISRQLTITGESDSDSASRDRRSSHKKSSRVEFVEETTTIHEYTRKEEFGRETPKKKKHSHRESSQQDTSRNDTSRKSDSHKNPPRKEPPRIVEPPRKKALPATVNGATSNPNQTTDSRRLVVPSSSKKSKDKAEVKNTTKTSVTTTTTERTTKPHGASAPPTPVKPPSILLPKFATNGLSRQQLELQQSLSIRKPCPRGFFWLKQKAGWRCAGGTHWLSDNQADRLHKGQEFGMMTVYNGTGPPETWTNPPDFQRHHLGLLHEWAKYWWDVGPSAANAAQGYTSQQRDVRKLLKSKAKCSHGLEWYKVLGGWKCLGGSHGFTDEQAERLARGVDVDALRPDWRDKTDLRNLIFWSPTAQRSGGRSTVSCERYFAR